MKNLFMFRLTLILFGPWSKKKWGDHLFEFLRKILLATPKPIYIGFGEWIGPTFLFATFFSDAAFGLEPQPDAYRVLFENTNVNRKVFGAHKIIVTSRLCIQHAPVSARAFGTLPLLEREIPCQEM